MCPACQGQPLKEIVEFQSPGWNGALEILCSSLVVKELHLGRVAQGCGFNTAKGRACRTSLGSLF